jgi:GNAT superfamily N-acetyltransferase
MWKETFACVHEAPTSGMVASPDLARHTTTPFGAEGFENVIDFSNSPTSPTFKVMTDKSLIAELMIRHWGSPRMLVGMHTYDVSEIDAHGLFDAEGKLLAFVSWKMRDKNMVLCALHSLYEGQGYARQTLQHLKAHARDIGARAIRSMVSNDNMPALAFYQKNGFRFATLYVGAVDAYRAVMPGMITHGYMGIPVHDALELELIL